MNRFLLIAFILLSASCRSSRVEYIPPDEYMYNTGGTGPEIEISFLKGEAHNHPLMAIWVEDEVGNFIQTLYVAESIGKGVFRHGDPSSGKWMPGEIRRPAALPYWSHRRGIMASDGLFVPDSSDPVPDAYTGSTPPGSFIIKTRLDDTGLSRFTLYFEINQSWDWNEHWTNNKFPGDKEYRSSCQPALVYYAAIDTNNLQREYILKVAGRSHHSGQSGELFSDLSTMTTALDIVKEIKVVVRK